MARDKEANGYRVSCYYSTHSQHLNILQVEKTVIDNTRAEDVDPAHWRRLMERFKRTRKDDGTDAYCEHVTDYLSTGSVLGEMSLLTGNASDVLVTCETSTQVGTRACRTRMSAPVRIARMHVARARASAW